MPQITMSFEQRRRVLLNKMAARSGGPKLESVIPFRNDDVPRFLRDLEKFEKRSRKSRLVVK